MRRRSGSVMGTSRLPTNSVRVALSSSSGGHVVQVVGELLLLRLVAPEAGREGPLDGAHVQRRLHGRRRRRRRQWRRRRLQPVVLQPHAPRHRRRQVVVVGLRALAALPVPRQGLQLEGPVADGHAILGVQRRLGVLVRREVQVGDALAALLRHLDRDVAVAPEGGGQLVANLGVAVLVAEVRGQQHLVLHAAPVVVVWRHPVGRRVAHSAPMLGGRLAPVASVLVAPRAVVVARHGPLAASAG
ncbi:hypothetical protein MTO96_016320 [Rhipicephalus appendiculatus]